jgi:hypothetical protein
MNLAATFLQLVATKNIAPFAHRGRVTTDPDEVSRRVKETQLDSPDCPAANSTIPCTGKFDGTARTIDHRSDRLRAHSGAA